MLIGLDQVRQQLEAAVGSTAGFSRVRSTALAIAYNIAVMLFGGFAQFFVTWLIKATGTPIAPAYYLMFGAAVGLLAALFLKERARDARFLVTDAVEPTAA